MSRESFADHGFRPCDPPDLTKLNVIGTTTKSKERKNFAVVTALDADDKLLTFRQYDSGEWTQWMKIEGEVR